MAPWARSVTIRRMLLGIVVGAIWLGASWGGLAWLALYANAPGPTAQVVSEWPVDSKLRLSEQGDTLILFAHPHCPCTRATLGELDKIVARYRGAVTTWVVFLKPTDSDESWEQSDLRDAAAMIPDAHIVSDLGGVEARRFHATTSGQTFLYSDQGRLLFNGGITLARGHAGDNPGRLAIESYLSGAVPLCRQTPVFGCPIAVSPEQE